VKLTTHLLLVPRSKNGWSCTSTPSICLHGVVLGGAQRQLYLTLPSIIRLIKSRRIKWEGHMTRMGEITNAYKILVGKRNGKRPLGIPRRGCEDRIRIYLKGIGWEGVEWFQLAQDRDQGQGLVNKVIKLRVP
jgi:hypothetical protein